MTKRILFFGGDQYHPAEDVLSGLQRSAPAEFTFEPAGEGSFSGDITPFDAVIIAKLNVSSPTDPTPWVDPMFDEAVSGFVENGGGLLLVHAGTVGYQPAPRIRALTGGEFTHHPEACDVTYKVLDDFEDAISPAEISLFDEHYFVNLDQNQRVFMTSNSHHGTQPAGWTSNFGEGRVCTLTPGHFAKIWNDDAYLQLVRSALRWVCGG